MSVWDEVVGQDQVVATLRAAVDASRVAAGEGAARAMTHAWLFTGPPGSGRSVAARAFAAALQCTDPTSPAAAGATPARRRWPGTHADVDARAHRARLSISIDEIRAAGLARRSARRRRAAGGSSLIEDADRMIERTSNVLLKAIEEPPPRTVWLLCAPSPEDVADHDPLALPRGAPAGARPPRAVAELLVRRDGVDAAMAALRRPGGAVARRARPAPGP